jgi:hypothetical protein
LKCLKYFAPTLLLVQLMFIRKTHMYNYIKSYYINEIIYFLKKEMQYQSIQLDHKTK